MSCLAYAAFTSYWHVCGLAFVGDAEAEVLQKR